MKVKLSNVSFAAVGKMISVILVFLAMFPVCYPTGHNTKHTLHNGGGRSDADNFVFLILGDAFTSSSADQTKFLNKARESSTMILNKYPYSLFKDRINIYAIETHSTSTSEGYFGTIKGGSFVKSWSATNIAAAVNQHAPNTSAIILYANTTSTAGWGTTSNVSGTNCKLAVAGMNATFYVMVHELGHAIGDLWDEYCSGTTNLGDGSKANTSADNNPNTMKWRAWLGVEQGVGEIGIYGVNNSNCKGIYTPSTYYGDKGQITICIMQGGGSQDIPYCRVCAAELTRILVNKTTKEAYQAKSDVTDASIPSGQSRIVDGAFHGCYKLKTVTIPANINSIGDYAFLRCTTLTTITNSATTPQKIDTTVFYGVNTSKVTLRVPDGSVAAYRAADVWKTFNIVSFSGGGEQQSNYKITFNTNGGNNIAEVTVTAGQAYTPPTPVKSGFTFTGWFTDEAFNNAWTASSKVVQNITLFARWSEAAKDWIVSFNTDGGSNIASKTVSSNNPYYNASNDIPTKSGFIFIGWFADVAKTTRWTSETQISGDVTLYAKWEAGTTQQKTYNVRLMWYENLGNNEHSWWKDYDVKQATVTVDNPYWYPQIDGMIFDSVYHATAFGYEGDSKSPSAWSVWTDGKSKLVSDTTLLLLELRKSEYVIKFNTNGGSSFEDVRVPSVSWFNKCDTCKYGFSVYVPNETPTKDRYNFVDWFADAALTKIWSWNSEIISDTTIHAKWEAVPDVPDSGGSAIKGNKGFDGKYGIIAVKNPVVGDFAEFVVKTPERWIDAKLTIYDNVGNVVFSDEHRLTISDNRMKWNLRNGNARAVVSGIYLAVVECKGANGVYQYYTKFGVRK